MAHLTQKTDTQCRSALPVISVDEYGRRETRQFLPRSARFLTRSVHRSLGWTLSVKTRDDRFVPFPTELLSAPSPPGPVTPARYGRPWCDDEPIAVRRVGPTPVRPLRRNEATARVLREPPRKRIRQVRLVLSPVPNGVPEGVVRAESREVLGRRAARKQVERSRRPPELPEIEHRPLARSRRLPYIHQSSQTGECRAGHRDRLSQSDRRRGGDSTH